MGSAQRQSGGPVPRVVVVGAGVQVTVIDRQNHHLFQPLLYQVATAAVSPADVAVPVRALFRDRDDVSVLMDEIADIDLAGRAVVSHGARYGYDYLVLATGSEYAYFGQDSWRERSLALKTLEEALEMRERILLAFEQAEMAAVEAERRRLMTFVIIGGGPTGVELAGAIAELARSALARDFRRIVPGEAEILLLEAGPALLAGFPKRLSEIAVKALQRKGATVRLNTPVRETREDAVVAGETGEVIPTATVLWAAGTRAKTLGGWPDAVQDRAGRIQVVADLSVPDHPEVFVIGDAAHVAPGGGPPLPAVAPVAKQQGAYVARLIRQRVAAGPLPPPFRYRDEGMLATIGRGAGVADLHWIKLTGWFGWVFWGLVHIFFLIDFRTRMMVFLNWAWAYVTYGLGARLITRRGRSFDRDP